MSKLDAPLLLEPEFKEKIWGRHNLEPLFPAPEAAPAASSKRDSAPRLIGEAWLTGARSRFLTGPVAGLTLGEVFKRWPAELCGASWKGAEFPLLAKFLFTHDWLSMQVHPDDAYAARHERSRGKTEAWYIIEAEPDAAIAVGLRAAATRKNLAIACREGLSRVAANIFHPSAGEVVFLPAGTVHAIGPGLVLFEVSETSDVTYRLDDYGRRDKQGHARELHLDRGLETARPELPAHRNLPRLQFPEPFGARRYALACPFFAVELLDVRAHGHFEAAPGRVEGLAVISGAGRVENENGWLAYGAGQTWLVPPAAGSYRLAPEERSLLVRFYVPDLDADFRQPLAKRGASPHAIQTVVFDP